MERCAKHKNTKCPMPCPVCLIEERDFVQADNALLTEQINTAISNNIRLESTNKMLKKSIAAEKKGHAATAEIVLDVQAKNKRLKARLEPAEFFLTEVLSLEQVLPLDLRNEANVIIDKVMAEINKWEVENKRLKEAIQGWKDWKKDIDELLKGNKKTFRQVLAENKLLKETQLTQSQREYLVKFLKLRLKTKSNQAIEEILEVLKEATDGKEENKD